MPTLTNLTRVTLASDEQIIARARRNLNVGAYMVQRWSMATWARGDITVGQWNEVSSHHTQEAAEKALARLNRKLAKQA